MREIKARETAVIKTQHFLSDLKQHCEGGLPDITITHLQDLHNVSRSTITACTALNIVQKIKKGQYNWIEGKPTRKMALQILDYFINLRKPQQPIIPEFSDLLTAVQQLTNIVGIYITQNENAVKRLKQPLLDKALNQASMSGSTLFNEPDRDDDRLFELVKAIAGGVLNSWETVNDYRSINIRIIGAAQDLLTKFNEHQK